MPDTKTSKQSKSQPQRQRFVETAKEAEADESGEEFEKAFAKIVSPKVHASDCAVHNGPAMKAGPCDCGLITLSERER